MISIPDFVDDISIIWGIVLQIKLCLHREKRHFLLCRTCHDVCFLTGGSEPAVILEEEIYSGTYLIQNIIK